MSTDRSHSRDPKEAPATPPLLAIPRDVEVVEVIHTRLLRRGDGRATVRRIIDQYWDRAGNLLAEVDPMAAVVLTRDEAFALLAATDRADEAGTRDEINFQHLTEARWKLVEGQVFERTRESSHVS